MAPAKGDRWVQLNPSTHRTTQAFRDAVKAGYARKLATGWKPRKSATTTSVPFDTRITFNCTTEEKAHWHAKATEMGFTSLSTYLRMALMELDNDLE